LQLDDAPIGDLVAHIGMGDGGRQTFFKDFSGNSRQYLYILWKFG
jgi:hypothetical protein